MKKYLYILFFILIFLLTHVLRLQNDVVNSDSVYWHKRSREFMLGLTSKQFDATYQAYHPGVTLMWIIGGSTNLLIKETFEDYMFETFHFVAKYSLIIVQLILSIILLFSLTKIFGYKTSFFMVVLLSLEPFFLGNSRLLHLDILLTLFMFLGLTWSYLYIRDPRWLKGIISGIFFGLAILTKSIGFGALLFSIIFGSLVLFRNQDYKVGKVFVYVLSLLLSCFAIVFLLFPAFRIDPKGLVRDIVKESRLVGIEKGHKQVFLGKDTKNPGVSFYPIILLLKISPFVLLGAVGYIYSSQKKLKITFQNYLGLFYMGYFGFILYLTKKIDRYILPIIPFLVVLAVLGYLGFIKKRKSFKYNLFVLLCFCGFIVFPLISLFPYYFTYTSPLFVNGKIANKIVGQKPFGVGIFDLRDSIVSRYGSDVSFGITDANPMKSISDHLDVYDIMKTYPNMYDVLVLGPNREFPKKVTESGVKFVHEYSLYINNLEYWRVFKRK